MTCKYLKKRIKNNNKERRIYYYCTLLKEEVSLCCYRKCDKKEYKCDPVMKHKMVHKKKTYGFKKKSSVINGKKHKLTKATEISQKTKKEVWERDNHRCIYCDTLVPLSCANSHYIKRSQLGLGIPQNVVTACTICHDKYDFGTNIDDMIEFTKNYLKSKYLNWNEEMLKYKKF